MKRALCNKSQCWLLTRLDRQKENLVFQNEYNNPVFIQEGSFPEKDERLKSGRMVPNKKESLQLNFIFPWHKKCANISSFACAMSNIQVSPESIRYGHQDTLKASNTEVKLAKPTQEFVQPCIRAMGRYRNARQLRPQSRSVTPPVHKRNRYAEVKNCRIYRTLVSSFPYSAHQQNFLKEQGEQKNKGNCSIKGEC